MLPETIDLTGYWFGIPKTYVFVTVLIIILLVVASARDEDVLYL